ncbi:MAG: MFS transporter [Gammaproteobacteria bacterium]|nr:MFS transporter [Gammaproteobacteria bacterium]
MTIESRAAWPIMPLDIYRNRTVLVSVSAMFLIGFMMFGGILFIPLFFQAVQGTSAAQSGAFLVPIMLGIVLGAATSGQLLSRSGVSQRALALSSTALAAAGMLALSTLTPETGVALALAYILVMGIGIGGVTSVFTVAVQNTVAHANIGAATAAVQFQRSVGGTVGVAVMGAVVAQRTSSRFLDALPESLRVQLPDGWMESMALAGAALDSRRHWNCPVARRLLTACAGTSRQLWAARSTMLLWSEAWLRPSPSPSHCC